MAGGLPFELPAMSLGEVMVKPTTMLYRNFLAMEVEELLRSLPIDGVVLLAGCDKTTPGTVMGAISMGMPTIFCPAGPMLNDRYLKPGQPERRSAPARTPACSGTSTRPARSARAEWVAARGAHDPQPGHLQHDGHGQHDDLDRRGAGPDAARQHAAIPAMDAGHTRMATDCGERIVPMVWDDLTPRPILTRGAFLNAVAVQMALGGSTNAAVHIIAMARRAGVDTRRSTTSTPWGARCRCWPTCSPAATG